MLTALSLAAGGCGSGIAGVATEQDTLVLDIRVHLLESPVSSALTTTLTEPEVAELLAEVSRVWGQAAIEWRIESFVREQANDPRQFDRMISGAEPATPRGLASVIPTDNLTDGAWHLFLIRDLGGLAGGIYFPGVPAVLQPETDPFGARALDGAVVRILAHELGHSLGLPHVPCTPAGNLMAPGCQAADRIRLEAGQIEQARAQAVQGPYRRGSPAF